MNEQVRKFLRVGLTGGIASGKSTVSRCFAEAGIPVIDADLLVRELSAPGGRAHDAIVARFGTADRRVLRERIYGKVEEKKALEAILHPLVQEESAARMKKLEELGYPGVIYEAALLVEAGRAGDFDEVIGVEAPLEVQRLMKRDGIQREQALAIVNAQLSDSARAKAATRVITNAGGVEELRDQVSQLFLEWFKK
jgi:dephospho-CoA kinase